MPGKNVAEEMYDFQDKYGFVETFRELEEAGRATARPFKDVDSFLATSDGISYESRQYLHGLTYMLNKYVDNNLKPELDSQKVYSLGNLNVMDFVNEYESIIQKNHEIKNPNTPRKPYAGIEVRVLKEAEKFAKGLNKSLIDIWADKIAQGTYSLSDLREQTKYIHAIDGAGHIKTLSMIHEAMEKASDQRGFGWKLNPLNWPRMFREYRYRNELSSKLERSKEKFLITREAVSEVRSTPMLDEKVYKDIEKQRIERETEIRRQQETALQAKLEQDAKKTKLTVHEAAPEAPNKNVDVQQKHQEVPTKELHNQLDK